ncbi:MAG TPA: serine protease [Candidatus Paceibacterota bacterium]
MPFFSSHSSFQEWGFVRDWNNRTTVVREVREVVIRTDEQVQRVAARAEGMVVGLESRSGSLIIGGSGFVVTSDGFLLTLASQVPQGYKVWVYLKEGVDPVLGEVLKRDIQKNLAIVKIDKRDLQTTGFALDDSVGAGAPVVLVAKSVEAGSLVTIVNQGSIRTRDKDVVRTNIFDKITLGGSPLLNLEGNIVGLSMFEPSGRLVAIPSSILRAFSGF